MGKFEIFLMLTITLLQSRIQNYTFFNCKSYLKIVKAIYGNLLLAKTNKAPLKWHYNKKVTIKYLPVVYILRVTNGR